MNAQAARHCRDLLRTDTARLTAATSPPKFGYSITLSVHQEATGDQDTADTDLCTRACGIGRERRAELRVRLFRWQ
jgi:hypothetical protein